MKNRLFFSIFVLAVILSLSALNCSSGGTSKVTVRINLPGSEHALNAPVRSIFNHLLSFFEREAAAAMPANLVSLILNVTGDGMDPINLSYSEPFPSSVEVEVPSGSSRFFELLASTPYATFRGVVTKDLAGGTTVDLPITMKLYETKIVIPDYQNGRIVQIDNLIAPNWKERTGSDIGYSGMTFAPVDADFDPQGRIIIANDEISTGSIILRIDDITSTGNTEIIAGTASGIDAMAIDRNKNLIHYMIGTTFYTRNIDGIGPGSPTNLSSILLGSVKGISVDEQGLVYLAGKDAAGYNAIFIYNPTLQAITNSVNSTTMTMLSTSTPWHILVKSPYLYIASPAISGSNNQILQLNMNLSFIQGYGTYAPPPTENTTPGYFYGPTHFVATLNRKIYIIDEAASGGFLSKLISMDDISGTNWATYGSYGTSGVGFFDFYNMS